METLFDGSRAFAHLKRLTVDLGHRLAGSTKERQAAAYIKAEFDRHGLKSRLQNFPIITYEPRLAKLEILEPKIGPIECELVGLSASTPPSGLLGELRFVETGDEEYLSSDLKGKILLVIGPVRFKKYAALMKVKPKAIIVIESQIGKPPSRVDIYPEWREKYGSVPMLRITLDDGLKLVQRKAKVARMVVLFREKKTRSANVIGDLKGTRFPEEIVVVGGHYDSVPGVQGASDNAGGTAIMLELARVFSLKGSLRTLRFVAWGSEELGLRGSVYYAQHLRDKAATETKKARRQKTSQELQNHRLCVNLDVHGVTLGVNQAMVLGPQDLVSSVRLLSKEIGPAIQITEDVHSSDSTALSRVGIPSLSLTRNGGTAAYLHTPLDAIDYLDAQHLGMYGTFAEEWISRYVANASSFPFETTVPDAHMKKVVDYFKKRRGSDIKD